MSHPMLERIGAVRAGRDRRLALLAGVLLAGGALLPAAGGAVAGSLPDFTIAKTASTASAPAGSTVAFFLIVSNIGPGPGAGAIAVDDPLPAGFTFVSASGSGWTCSTSGTTVTCQKAASSNPLGVGASLPPITIVVTADPAAVGTTPRNCATVRDATAAAVPTEVTTANNAACAEVRITAQLTGSICVAKFEDIDADGRKDANEPWLADWKFTATNSVTGQQAALTSTATGRNACATVPVGSYAVGETLLPGWRQTRPAGGGPQTVTVTANATVNVSFGNVHERCCLDLSVGAGKKDNFVSSDGLAGENGLSALPIPTVLSKLMNSFSGPRIYETSFDWNVDGPTLFSSRIALPTGGCISGARYEIAVKPSPFVTGPNQILLRIPGTGGATWLRKFAVLSPSGISPSKTFTWNLGSMPAGGANLVPALNLKRTIDTFVAPGLAVDYIRVTFSFCECGGSGDKK